MQATSLTEWSFDHFSLLQALAELQASHREALGAEERRIREQAHQHALQALEAEVSLSWSHRQASNSLSLSACSSTGIAAG